MPVWHAAMARVPANETAPHGAALVLYSKPPRASATNMCAVRTVFVAGILSPQSKLDVVPPHAQRPQEVAHPRYRFESIARTTNCCMHHREKLHVCTGGDANTVSVCARGGRKRRGDWLGMSHHVLDTPCLLCIKARISIVRIDPATPAGLDYQAVHGQSGADRNTVWTHRSQNKIKHRVRGRRYDTNCKWGHAHSR